MFRIIHISFLLGIFIIFNVVLSSCTINEFRESSKSQEDLSVFEEDVMTLGSIPISQTSGQSVAVLDSPHSDSGGTQTLIKDKRDDDMGIVPLPPKRFPVNKHIDSSSIQDTPVGANSSKLDENKTQTYSVETPFGVDGQPLLSGNTNIVKGYQSNPQPNDFMSLPYAVPTSHDSFWNGVNPKRSQSGTQWTSSSSFWDSRRMVRPVTNVPYNSVGGTSSNQTPEERRESEQNRELVKSILTKALDILTLERSETKIECQDDKGITIPCTRSSFSDSNGDKKMKKKFVTNSKDCIPGVNGKPCPDVLNYNHVFGPWLRKRVQSQSGRHDEHYEDVRSGPESRRVGFSPEHDHQLPRPRTRTVFRSVETSPTSSLARLLNPNGVDSTEGGGRGNNGGGGSSGGSGGGNSNTGNGNVGDGSVTNNNNGGGGGGGVNGGGGASVGASIPVGVSLEMFSKFARDVVSFEQQSATEIKRLDNLLRQLAMAAQTDFTSVSTSVNTLQQELVRTQQQLVQAWSILNATHVKDTLQAVGDLHDVKTDVYRLHALMTGATPLGQGTAQGRAAEVKDVVTIGPGVDCAALYKSGVNTSGVYDLQPQPGDNGTRMTAFCDMDTEGGGWTVFQRRRDGSDDFFRGWNSYKHGFGSYKHDHWLGLENIHLLTKYGDNVMRIELTDWDNKTRWAEFSYTRIMGESDGYRILVGGYRGTAGDPFHSLSYSMRMQSMRFSTFDSDNDLDTGGNCALTFTSGWWFNKCFQVNLNGVWYGNSRYAGPSMNGIVWDLWPEHFNGYSLKHTEIKLRPADFLDKK